MVNSNIDQGPFGGFAAVGHMPVVQYRGYLSNTDPFNWNYTESSCPIWFFISIVPANVPAHVKVQQIACNIRYYIVPSAFILLSSHNRKLNVYIQLSKLSALHSLPTSDWDQRMSITKGKLHNNQSLIVEYFLQYIHHVNQIWDPTNAAIIAMFTDLATLKTILMLILCWLWPADTLVLFHLHMLHDSKRSLGASSWPLP